jgi:hypothetical protein
MDERLDKLQVNLEISMKVVPSPFLRAFAGTGPKRRRELIGALEIGQRLAKPVRYMHRVYEDGREVDEADLADFLYHHLQAVPDEQAKRVTDKNDDIRSSAFKEIATALVKAISANWTIKYEPKTLDLPGQGVKWDSANSQGGLERAKG